MLIVLLAVLIVIYLVRYYWQHRRLPVGRVLAGVIVLFILWLTVSGRFPAFIAGTGLVLGVLWRAWPWIARGLGLYRWYRDKSPCIQLEFSEEGLEGQILSGPLAGKALKDLDEQALLRLQVWCEEQQDHISLRRLAQWQALYKQGKTYQQDRDQPQSNDHDEALAILGLTEPLTEEKVLQAHRTLIHAVHPDRGGSAWLAARINHARDVLLEALDKKP
ncbi:hypothetical protein ACKC9G_10835 [Pokkaliibacter sp. CJK22405]|uniref:hypothetical protein n=1 Tax=Pokkaliibacter sp. CJK22405 TaxID=3384615 RepID=UPI00398558D7